MKPTSQLYNALMEFLRQSDVKWLDIRHVQTLCWMIIGIIHSEQVHLSVWGIYTQSRTVYAQSHQRRFRRWLSNRRINLVRVYQALLKQTLGGWGEHRLYLSLDTTMVWNRFCIVWLGVIYRGRTIPVAWQIVPQASSTVRLSVLQSVLRQAHQLLPDALEVVLLADRGFADRDLMKYLKDKLGWHYRIRIKRHFYFQYRGVWQSVKSVKLNAGQARFVESVRLGKTKPYGTVHLAFAHDQASGEFWAIVTDEVPTLQVFQQYAWRFQVEENFLALKSNAFDLEASRLRDKDALFRLCGVLALTMLFLTLQGTEVVTSGNRRRVDPHWFRGMSYLKLGWNWVRLCLTHNWKIELHCSLSGQPDPQPAVASKKQRDRSLEREFTVSHWKAA